VADLITGMMRRDGAGVPGGRLTDEQFSRLETTLNQVEEASRRIGRKDWTLLLGGAIFSMTVGRLGE
jgi:hypothetical protein